MTNFIGFRLRAAAPRDTVNQPAPTIPAAHADQDAQGRLIKKINSLGEAFFKMPQVMKRAKQTCAK